MHRMCFLFRQRQSVHLQLHRCMRYCGVWVGAILRQLVFDRGQRYSGSNGSWSGRQISADCRTAWAHVSGNIPSHREQPHGGYTGSGRYAQKYWVYFNVNAWYEDCHHQDLTAVRPSHCYNGNYWAGKTFILGESTEHFECKSDRGIYNFFYQFFVSDSTLWGLLWQKQVWRAGTVSYIPQYLWDVITCPCPWYLLLAH